MSFEIKKKGHSHKIISHYRENQTGNGEIKMAQKKIYILMEHDASNVSERKGEKKY